MKAAAPLDALAAAAAESVLDAVVLTAAAAAAAAASGEVHQERFADPMKLQLACCEGTLETGPADWPWSCGSDAARQLG